MAKILRTIPQTNNKPIISFQNIDLQA